MKTYEELSLHEKIQLKQVGINIHGKKWHMEKPNILKKLNELSICILLNNKQNIIIK